MKKDWYEEACHGYDGKEDVEADHSKVWYLVLVMPILIGVLLCIP